MLFASFKIFGCFASFFTNIYCSMTSRTILDIIKDYVAVHIISEINKLMAGTVLEEDSVGCLKLFVAKNKTRMTDIDIWNDFIKTDCKFNACSRARKSGKLIQPLLSYQKVVLIIFMIAYRLLSIIYHVVYFYFAPFIITLILVLVK